MSFDLRGLIRDVLTTSDSPDPGVIAAEVNERTPAKYLREAYRQTLRDFVRVMAHAHPTSPPTRSETTPKEASSAGSRTTLSTKVASIREYALRQRYHVEGKWMFLGDMTRDDLLFAANERYRLAHANHEAAEGLSRIAEALSLHEVNRVRDLPPDVFDTLRKDLL